MADDEEYPVFAWQIVARWSAPKTEGRTVEQLLREIHIYFERVPLEHQETAQIYIEDGDFIIKHERPENEEERRRRELEKTMKARHERAVYEALKRKYEPDKT